MLNLRLLALLSLYANPITSFGFDPSLLQHSINAITHHGATTPAPTSPAFLQGAQNVLEQYKHALAAHPLQTKMTTGAVLATCGDAIAQSKEEGPYDVRRAASFGTFDMAYRALQHASFPLIVEHCRGQFFGGALAGLFATTHLQIGPEMTNNFAAMEQTLASQLGVVPFFYYPVFFALTGFMQGLTVEGSVDRAKEMFVPLMQRNLLFWIPVQFVQFGFIEDSLQIPFLSVCGLGWTFILSIMAGSTKTYQESADEAVALEEDMVFSSEQLDEIGAAVIDATGSQQQSGYVYEQR